MDAIDNLIYTTRNLSVYRTGASANAIQSEYLLNGTNVLNETEPLGVPNRLVNLFPTINAGGISAYTRVTRENFVAFDDPGLIYDSMQKHWYDVAGQISYTSLGGMIPPGGFVAPGQENAVGFLNRIFADFTVPPYHLIFSYLVENTRIVQIFERLISMYQHDEKLSKANSTQAFQWLQNTEALFFDSSGFYKPLVSFLRPVPEAIRRNAYQRMFGMDLAFGDANNKDFNYIKADFANSAFITLFESFLVEIWQAYTNANNTSGQNSTDVLHIEEIVRKLQEMLMLRRTSRLDFRDYPYYNLSKEEFSSYISMFWLLNIISYDSSIVDFLNCSANTAGERLINIGKRVGLPAHTKSVALLDIAHPMNALLRLIELGTLNNPNQLDRIIRSRSTVNPNNPVSTAAEIAIMDNLLLILNNWEKATGHRIKNPDTVLSGGVRLQQPPARTQQVPPAVRPVPAMN